jgi:Protease II
MNAPKAEKKPFVMTHHGHGRTDNYYWFNDRSNPEVIAYLESENAYTAEMLKPTEALQEKLFKEMVGRIKQDDSSVPVKKNGYFYYVRYEEGKEYPIYCRKKESVDNEEEVLLDGNAMAQDLPFFHIGGYSVSPDNDLLAYSVDTVSRRLYKIYIKNLKNGELFPEIISDTSGTMTWANDNKTLFYCLKDESLRPNKIMRHELATDSSKDVEVYHEEDEAFVTFVAKTKSQKYIVIGCDSTLSSEYRFVNADDPHADFKVLQKRMPDMLYDFDHMGDSFFIKTNADGATNYKIMKTSVDHTEKEYWTEVVPHRQDVMIEGFELFTNYFVIEERKSGLVMIRVQKWDGSADYYIDFGEPAYDAGLGSNLDFDSKFLRFGYTSMTTPSSVYDYDMDTKVKILLKRQEVIGGYNPEDYITERLMAPSHDGVLIPISLVYKKGLQKDGQNPLVLYGYGSYGMSMDAYFSSARLSLLGRGFVWAITHIRGGEEMGRKWYEDGKMLKKMNTFKDFIACGQYLVDQHFTSPSKMFAMGGSAGGLLVGAVANMAPKLWKGIIAQVPFVDVVTTMLDDSIPLTTGEYDEWGNPNEKIYYEYMLSYSPYDNVEAKEYPAMLVTTGLHDSQVQYWEPAKWVAKLREKKTDNHDLFLKTEMDYGHGGASGRFESYKEVALEYAFMLYELGLADN